MEQADINYRNEHGVLPQLDFVNFETPFDNIPENLPVQLTQYATTINAVKADAGKIASGALDMGMSFLHMLSGNVGFGIGKAIRSGVDIGAGIVDPAHLGANQRVTETIKEMEMIYWKHLSFLRNFVPASGNIGDIVYKDGSCDEFHCGNGHRFFDNGDYFEGLFIDGHISSGLYIWQNGMKYLGSFDETGYMTGIGTILYPDGAHYSGDIENSNRHGFGGMWYTDGVYVGYWENNVRHGEGYLKLENGKFFDGEFYNDQMVE